MYAKHFFKMLLLLSGMAIIGIAGLLISNHYAQHSVAASSATSYANGAVILRPEGE